MEKLGQSAGGRLPLHNGYRRSPSRTSCQHAHTALCHKADNLSLRDWWFTQFLIDTFFFRFFGGCCFISSGARVLSLLVGRMMSVAEHQHRAQLRY